jgi:3-oxoadipate enol-lactonase
LTLPRARRSLKAKNISLSEFWSRMIATATPPSGTAESHSPDRYLDVQNAQLRYRDEGRGPAVILLHGWTLDLEMWDPQVAALRNEFRLVRLDRRGFGLSRGRPDARQDASDIAALYGHLGLHRAALIGMSHGARSSLQFAAGAPARVSALILDGPPAVDRAVGEDDVPIARLREVLAAHGIEAFRREWSNHPLARLRSNDAKIRQMLNGMIARYPGLDLAARDDFAGRDGADAGAAPLPLHAVTAPTLILSGAHDLPSRLHTARRLCARLPAAEHEEVADAGHLINLDRPALYSELCRSFLSRHTIIAAD